MRRRMLASLGGAKLPYDAEVEYIGFRGEQYAELPFTVNSGRYNIAVVLTDTTTEQCLIGCRTGSNNKNYPLHVAGGKWNLVYGYASINSSEATTSRVSVSASITSGLQRLSVDSKDEVVGSSRDPVNSNTALLGACNVSGRRQIFAKANVYALKVYSLSDDLLFDAIPVRFANELGISEGAMYDRVSGELFRNAGTGAFIIGPDK